MLSTEFIPSSDDFDEVGAPLNNSANTSGKAVRFSTNPEPTKFVPPPKIQFFYSLQKNSLRTVIDTLLSNTDIGHICTVFTVSGYGKWLKKKQAADLLVEHLLILKQAQQRDKFNLIVEKINTMKGKEMLGRIPKLPGKINAIGVLKRSYELKDKITRPTFPVRLNSPLKEITGLIFLDEVEEEFKTSFTLDLYFTIPASLENCGSGIKFVLCVYQSNERITTRSSLPDINTVSPTLLDLTLNGVSLEQGNCRFRNHDSYDITLLCCKDRANLLRILRHETHIDLNHLIIEIVAVSIAGSLSESRPIGINRFNLGTNTNSHSHGHQSSKRFIDEDEEISFLKDKYLKQQENGNDLKFIKFEDSLKSLTNNNNNSDDIEILEDKLTFSLKCPISFTRIVEPVKFKSCKHGQCFDLSNWRNLTQNILNLKISSRSNESSRKKLNLKVSCPICGLNLEEDRSETFISCGLFKKFLSTAERNDVSVELNIKSGEFSFIKEEDTESDWDSLEIEPNNTSTNTITRSDESIPKHEIVNIIDSDDDFDTNSLLSYQVDKSKPIGSCPSRAIPID